MSVFKNFNDKQGKNSLTPEFIFQISVILTWFTNGDFLDSVNNGREVNDEMLLPYLVANARFDKNVSIEKFHEGIFIKSIKYIEEKGIYSDSGFNLQMLSEFIENASDVLNEQQKLAILINMGDLILSDGIAEEYEQELFSTFLDGFGISEEDFQPYLNTLMIKHDRSLF